MKRAIAFLLFSTALILGLTAGAQTPPDPASYPPGSQIYTIVEGDTLWDIAQQVYGDPYRWPQLWEQNQYIQDADLIYPGNPLLIPQGLQQTAAGMAGPPLSEFDPNAADAEDPFQRYQGEGRPGEGPAISADEPEEPIQLGYESDIYCTGYIGDESESFPYRIASSEYEFLHPTLDNYAGSSIKAEIKGLFGPVISQKYNLGTGDITYLEGGRADGLSAGDILTVIEPGRKIVHPRDQVLVGRYYHYRGRIRVLSVQEETAIGEIVFLCDGVNVGMALAPFIPEPVPLERLTPMRPINYPPKAEDLEGSPMIISAFDEIVTLGIGHLAYIDHGASHDVVPGDIYTIYREGRRGYPPILLGEVGVLSVSENASLIRILRNRYSIHVGDVLEKK